MLYISPNITIHEDELSFSAIRAQGSGGQNVNKVSSAIHLRFDIHQSSLPDDIKQRLLALSDQRINKSGTIVIKAQTFRTQEKNRDDAIDKLVNLIRSVLKKDKPRKATKPTKASQKRRMDKKKHRGKLKTLRGKVSD